jgi:hypothetical protein
MLCKVLLHAEKFFGMGPPALLSIRRKVLQIFIAIKNPSRLPGLNPDPLGPVTSTLNTTP